MVTDPYHDRNLRISGYPDGKPTTSAIKRITAQTTVTCPFVLAPGEVWDFHVFSTPLHYKTDFKVSNMSSGFLQQSATPTVYTFGPVNIIYRKYSSGNVITGQSVVALGNANSSSTMSSTRTVSLGFELHNTTAELYKEGAITAYRSNPISDRVDASYSVPTLPNERISLTHICTVPDNITQVNQMPNSRTWEAAAGIYSVPLPAPNNTFETCLPLNVGFSVGTLTNSYMTNIVPGAAYTVSWSPLSCTGAMSSKFPTTNTQLVLDFRQVLEEMPSPYSEGALTYSSTAPEADLLFLKLYKRMYNTIEPGVPVSFNSAGEWFRRIISLAKDNLPALVNLLPPNYRAPAMATLPLINQVADKIISKLDKPKQPQQQPRPAKVVKPVKKRIINPRNLSILRAKAQRFAPSRKQ